MLRADVNARVSALTEVEAEIAAQYVLVTNPGKDSKGKIIVEPKALTKKIEVLRGELKVADEQQRTKEWRTPLIMAERGGHKDVVSFLLAAGARE